MPCIRNRMIFRVHACIRMRRESGCVRLACICAALGWQRFWDYACIRMCRKSRCVMHAYICAALGWQGFWGLCMHSLVKAKVLSNACVHLHNNGITKMSFGFWRDLTSEGKFNFLYRLENVCFWTFVFSPFLFVPTLFFLPSPLLFFCLLWRGGKKVEVHRGRSIGWLFNKR